MEVIAPRQKNSTTRYMNEEKAQRLRASYIALGMIKPTETEWPPYERPYMEERLVQAYKKRLIREGILP